MISTEKTEYELSSIKRQKESEIMKMAEYKNSEKILKK